MDKLKISKRVLKCPNFGHFTILSEYAKQLLSLISLAQAGHLSKKEIASYLTLAFRPPLASKHDAGPPPFPLVI